MSKRRDLSREEWDLWRRATRTTIPRPSAPRPGHHPLEEPPQRETPPKKKKPAAQDTPAPARPPEVPAALTPERPPASPWTGGLDAATARRARRGKLGVEATIDLHGMRQADAHTALIHFIQTSTVLGRRCVLVITGKGGGRSDRRGGEDAPFMTGAGGERGILRRQVPQWLAQEPLRTRIFAVEQAHQRDGGGGALYVFLRKPDQSR